MARQTAITANTYQRLYIDSGKVVLDYGEVGEADLGATRGGNSFNIATEYRTMEADGARGPVVGSRRITNVEAKITANLLEMTDDNLALALPGSTNTDQTTYKSITRSLQLATTDHLTNVALVGEVSGSATVPVICLLSNPIVDGGFEASFTDKDETVIPYEFTGHFSASDLDTEPWEIRHPVF